MRGRGPQLGGDVEGWVWSMGQTQPYVERNK
jgi:hypothetical protein